MVGAPKIIETRVCNWLRIGAITIFPFGIFIAIGYNTPRVRRHEGVHWYQQRLWALRGLGIGLLVWFLLYLLLLPALWNPFRRKWETEAFVAEGVSLVEINKILRRWPYLLRW